MEWLNGLDHALVEWGRSLGYATESIFRLVLAMLCGGAIGLERELRGREAGFRTHALVCLGSALVMIVSVHFAYEPWRPPELPDNVQLNIDPSRIAYGVMTGIGFLGAGSIIKHGASVQGLTTAAGLWCVAAMGLAAGFGQYGVTLLATLLILFTLLVMDYLGQLLPKQHRYQLVVRRPWRSGCLEATVAHLNAAGLPVFSANLQRSPDLKLADVRLNVTVKRHLHDHDIERTVESDGECLLISTTDG